MHLEFSVGHNARLRVLYNEREIFSQDFKPGDHRCDFETPDEPGTSVTYLKLEGASGEFCWGVQKFSELHVGKQLLSKAKAVPLGGRFRARSALLRKAVHWLQMTEKHCPELATAYCELSSTHLAVRCRPGNRSKHLHHAINWREYGAAAQAQCSLEKEYRKTLIELSLLYFCCGALPQALKRADHALEIERAGNFADADSINAWTAAAFMNAAFGRVKTAQKIVADGLNHFSNDSAAILKIKMVADGINHLSNGGAAVFQIWMAELL